MLNKGTTVNLCTPCACGLLTSRTVVRRQCSGTGSGAAHERVADPTAHPHDLIGCGRSDVILSGAAGLESVLFCAVGGLPLLVRGGIGFGRERVVRATTSATQVGTRWDRTIRLDSVGFGKVRRCVDRGRGRSSDDLQRKRLAARLGREDLARSDHVSHTIAEHANEVLARRLRSRHCPLDEHSVAFQGEVGPKRYESRDVRIARQDVDPRIIAVANRARARRCDSNR